MSRAVLLTSSPSDRPSIEALVQLAHTELVRAGYSSIERHELSATRLAYCRGEFDCWVKTPGHCRVHDAETELVQQIHDADVLVLVGAVTFGAHDSAIKRSLDRLLCLLSPFFEQRAQLTHHQRRYERYPRIVSLGLMADRREAEAHTFEALTEANAVNFFAPSFGVAVVHEDNRGAWEHAVREALRADRIAGAPEFAREGLREVLLEACTGSHPNLGAPTSVALLVGSAKQKGTSASEALSRALEQRLRQKGLMTELHFVTELANEGEPARAAIDAMHRCDLLVLVTPLYVDALPSLAMRAFEKLLRSHTGLSLGRRFAMLVNCGFPEAEHCRYAAQIAGHFAARASYAYSGTLALGAGGVVPPESPLDKAHGPITHVVRALDLCADALAEGSPLSREAIEEMATPPMPEGLYRVIAEAGFRWQAQKNGVAQHDLRARPLET